MWDAVEEILVPLLLRSISLSMGLVQKESHENGSICSTILYGFNTVNDKPFNLLQFGMIPISVSCHILTSLLDIVLKTHYSSESSSNVLENGHCQTQNITGNLMWHLCNLTVQSLIDVSESRTFIITLVLPSVFRAFKHCHTFNVSFYGEEHVLYRYE